MRSTDFPKSLRLRKRGEFLSLNKKGKGFFSDGIYAQWMRTERSRIRLGLTVSAKTGSSVERNLFKRRAREAFRLSSLRSRCGVDINLKPRGTLSHPFHSFAQFFTELEKYLFG